MHWSGCGAVPRRDEATYVDIGFIRYTKRGPYTRRLMSTVKSSLNLGATAPAIDRLDYVTFAFHRDIIQI